MNTLDRRSLRLAVLDVGSLDQSVRLAPRVESFGYGRYWISEHHGEDSIPNPLVLLPAIAGLTETMRVGTAAVLLRFQSPLAVTESFRMLERLFPGRIDAGVGRGAAKPVLTSALSDGRSAAYTTADHEARVREVQRLLHGQLPAEHPLVGERIESSADAGRAATAVGYFELGGGRDACGRDWSELRVHDHFNWQAGPASVRKYVAEFQPSLELARPTFNVTVAGYCTEDATEAASIKARWFDRTVAERRAFVGSMSYSARPTRRGDRVVTGSTRSSFRH